MKATDFDLSKDMVFDPSVGMVRFRDSRLVVFDANAIGLLRQEMIDAIGRERARRLFLRLGYQHGYSDFMQMKLNYSFDSEMDLLASGPVIHTWEGIVKATPTEFRYDRERKEFYFTGVWTNSYEAQQHLTFDLPSADPVCWSLMGYASGWCTAFAGFQVVCVEPVCVGKGDDHCEWLIQPPSAWGDSAKPYIDALSDLAGR